MGVGWFRCFRLYSPPYALEIVFSLFFFIATIFKWLAFRLLFAHKKSRFCGAYFYFIWFFKGNIYLGNRIQPNSQTVSWCVSHSPLKTFLQWIYIWNVSTRILNPTKWPLSFRGALPNTSHSSQPQLHSPLPQSPAKHLTSLLKKDLYQRSPFFLDTALYWAAPTNSAPTSRPYNRGGNARAWGRWYEPRRPRSVRFSREKIRDLWLTGGASLD